MLENSARAGSGVEAAVGEAGHHRAAQADVVVAGKGSVEEEVAAAGGDVEFGVEVDLAGVGVARRDAESGADRKCDGGREREQPSSPASGRLAGTETELGGHVTSPLVEWWARPKDAAGLFQRVSRHRLRADASLCPSHRGSKAVAAVGALVPCPPAEAAARGTARGRRPDRAAIRKPSGDGRANGQRSDLEGAPGPQGRAAGASDGVGAGRRIPPSFIAPAADLTRSGVAELGRGGWPDGGREGGGRSQPPPSASPICMGCKPG